MTSPPNNTTGWNATTTRTNFTLNPKEVRPGKSGQALLNQTEMPIQTFNQARQEYFDKEYKLMTGLRIAGTLGGFFLLVLLTLCYKSKCKKHSRDPSPVPPLDLSQLPSPIPLHRLDFDSGDDSNDRMAMLDPSYFINMNQIHPYTHYPSQFADNNNSNHHRHVNSPAVLLTANSESSEDEELSVSGSLSLIGPPTRPLIHPRTNQYHQQHHHNHHLNPATLSPPIGGSTSGGKMKWLQQNIDIHVILPTPTISPSGSEHFTNANNNQNPHNQSKKKKIISVDRSRLGSTGGGGGNASCREYYNYYDRDRSSSVGSNSFSSTGPGPGVGGVGSFTGNPLFFLDNLKYVDDTSSENIPTNEDQDQDTRSIGSDSVFACFEHNFDHVDPDYVRRKSSVSGYSGLSSSMGCYPGFKSPSPISAAGPGSGTGGGDDEESECKITLTQAHAQVHHRDSFCSELESINDYLENNRRRSSSTQTTLSDLQQCLSISWTGGGGTGSAAGGGSLSHSPRLSPHLFKQMQMGQGGQQQLPSATVNRQISNSPALLSVGPMVVSTGNNNPMSRMAYPRKRSFDALLMRKAYSLQCDEPTISLSSTKSPRK